MRTSKINIYCLIYTMSRSSFKTLRKIASKKIIFFELNKAFVENSLFNNSSTYLFISF